MASTSTTTPQTTSTTTAQTTSTTIPPDCNAGNPLTYGSDFSSSSQEGTAASISPVTNEAELFDTNVFTDIGIQNDGRFESTVSFNRNYQIDTWIIELIPDSCTPQTFDVSFKDNNNGGNVITTSYNVNPEVTTNGPTVTQIVLDIGTTLSNNGLTNILTDEITISFTSTGCSASGPIQIYAITFIGGPCDPITTTAQSSTTTTPQASTSTTSTTSTTTTAAQSSTTTTPQASTSTTTSTTTAQSSTTTPQTSTSTTAQTTSTTIPPNCNAGNPLTYGSEFTSSSQEGTAASISPVTNEAELFDTNVFTDIGIQNDGRFESTISFNRNYQIDTWIVELIPDSCTPQSFDVSFKDNNNGGNIVTTSYNVNPEVTTNGPTVTQIVLDIGTTLSNNGLTNILTDEITISFTSTGCSTSGPIQIYAITFIGGPCDPTTTTAQSSTTTSTTAQSSTTTTAQTSTTTSTTAQTSTTTPQASTTSTTTTPQATTSTTSTTAQTTSTTIPPDCNAGNPLTYGSDFSSSSQEGTASSISPVSNEADLFDTNVFTDVGVQNDGRFESTISFNRNYQIDTWIIELIPDSCTPQSLTVSFKDNNNGGNIVTTNYNVNPEVTTNGPTVTQIVLDIGTTLSNNGLTNILTDEITISFYINWLFNIRTNTKYMQLHLLVDHVIQLQQQRHKPQQQQHHRPQQQQPHKPQHQQQQQQLHRAQTTTSTTTTIPPDCNAGNPLTYGSDFFIIITRRNSCIHITSNK